MPYRLSASTDMRSTMANSLSFSSLMLRICASIMSSFFGTSLATSALAISGHLKPRSLSSTMQWIQACRAGLMVQLSVKATAGLAKLTTRAGLCSRCDSQGVLREAVVAGGIATIQLWARDGCDCAHMTPPPGSATFATGTTRTGGCGHTASLAVEAHLHVVIGGGVTAPAGTCSDTAATGTTLTGGCWHTASFEALAHLHVVTDGGVNAPGLGPCIGVCVLPVDVGFSSMSVVVTKSIINKRTSGKQPDPC
mmetsp:Transcript_65822/g.122781  ORF Transcript_65822/g.122781 Transcript_65822/m.122781 type:complete len:252 (-) Transcript_65822:89-844(-)